MSVSRDDFSIAFRSALLQRGGAQKFSILSLIFLAIIIFFLDVYGVKFTKPIRGFLNDVVYRITFLASTPSRFVPAVGKDISSFFNVRKENEKLKAEIEKYKSLELNVEFLTDENKNLQKILETEYFKKNENVNNAYKNWYSHVRSFGIGNYLNNDFISGSPGKLPKYTFYNNL